MTTPGPVGAEKCSSVDNPQTQLLQWIGPGALLSCLEHLVFIVGVIALLLYLGHRLFGERKSATVIATRLFFSTLGWLMAITLLLLFNRLYLRAGRVVRKR